MTHQAIFYWKEVFLPGFCGFWGGFWGIVYFSVKKDCFAVVNQLYFRN